MKTILLISGIVGVALSIACGGSAIPVTKVADSKATIRAAEEAGAKSNPQAALHLKMAQDQLNQAQVYVNDDENERAALFLNQSQADAELALALAHEAKERNATKLAQARLQTLQSGR
ncbi:MAG TPA: DUF4398 domain-containing protein [Polyangiaceae bacterium]|nr:DUF4398 domain-containing protein [Polyangiaceae bacterium]